MVDYVKKFSKDQSAITDYTFDWSAWLAPMSDTIASQSFSLTPAGPTLGTVTPGTYIGTVRVDHSAGVVGKFYMLAHTIITTAGRKDTRRVQILVTKR